jgi:DNA polymerase-3 subunit delta'
MTVVMSETQNYRIEVVGHEWAIELFKRQHDAGRVPQSLLLTGPLNAGKATLARYFAQYLNCTGDNPPCGQCRSCRKMISGNHPDIRVVDTAETETLKIDQVRELQHELSLSPVEGRYRVAVLGNFERATTGAANALLKTLEEPASQVVLILTAPDPGSLLPTIVSRCQTITLRPLPTEAVQIALRERWQASPEQAGLLAQLAGGRLGWAVRALTDESFLERRTRHFADLTDLLRMHRAERLEYAQALSRDSLALREALILWLLVWRDVLLLNSGSATKIINLDWYEKLQAMAQYSSVAQAGEMVARLQTTLLNLDKNVNPRLNLEVLLLKLPRYSN